jgi:hypothetical protein
MTFTLNNIITGKEKKPPIIVYYAPQGFGKSTWASQAPTPIFIPVEDGIGTLDFARFPKVESFNQLLEAVALLGREDHPYKTVVIDTLSALEALIHQEVRDQHGQDIFANYGNGYKLVDPYITKLTAYLSKLRDVKKMMVIVLAHCKTERYESPETSAYDRHTLNCHADVAKRVHNWADIVFFGNYKVFTTKEDMGFNRERTLGSGKGDRVIYTQERPAFLAKNRYDLPFELPCPKKFYWDKLLDEIDKKLGGVGDNKSVETVKEN